MTLDIDGKALVDSRAMATPLESLLNDDQREQLATFFERRIEAIKGQLGTFWEKRKRYYAQMQDDFEWRSGEGSVDGTSDRWFSKATLEQWGESIFDLQNDSLNIVGGFAAFMVARTVDDIFGSEPYFNIYPEGTADKPLSESIQKHTEWRMRKCPWREAALDAIDLAIGLGEAVVWQSWDREVDVYEVRATVLYNIRTKQPVLTTDGQYFFGEPSDPESRQSPPDVFEVGMMTGPQGQQVAAYIFQKAPLEPVPVSDVVWEEMEIEQTNVTYDNIRASTIASEDFLCDENAPSLEESDFVGRRIQRRLSYLITKYKLSPEVIAQLEGDTDEAKTEEAKPSEVRRENPLGFSYPEQPDPMIELIEGWVRHDPIGDRRQRRMVGLYAVRAKILISLDYIANVTPKGELPCHVVRAFRVKGRWWGRGYYEIYEKAQEFIDRHLNYIAYRNRFHSNPVVFYDESVLFEDDESEEFQLRPGASYKLKSGHKKEDCMSVLELPDLDERTWMLLELMMQVIQARSGVTGAAQGNTGDLPANSTATGVNAIIQNGSVLAKLPMSEMKRGLEKSMSYSVLLFQANMRPREVFTYFEGEEQMVGELLAAQVQGLDMNVHLLLTRFQQREAKEAATGAIATINAYIATPEPEKPAVRPLYLQAIKAYGFDSANTIVRQPTPTVDPLTGQPIQPMAPEANPTPTPPAP